MAAVAHPNVALPWADTPLALVHTPQFETNKTDIFTTGATHMCLLHNAILRGYNSIYHQATHVDEDQDRADFIGYCLAWFKLVKSHHDDEEDVLFGQVEDLLDDKTVWRATHKEHEAFLPGLTEFHDYLVERQASPLDFSGTELLDIMATFEEPFALHFRSEIATIAALADHANAPQPGTPREADAAAMFKAWGKNTVSKAGMFDVVPFFLMNHDRSPEGFEDGRWANWPPMPAPIRWGLINLAGAWYSGWWQYASCDSAGRPQTLYTLRSSEPAAGKEL